MAISFKDLAIGVNKTVPGSIVDLTRVGYDEFPHIPTGSFIVDYVTAIGGLPRGRITELYGLQGSGKTTTGLQTIAQAQLIGLGALMLDYENSLDPNYAKNLGVDLDPNKLAYSQPSTMEEGFRIAKYYMENAPEYLGVILVDSVAAMQTMQDKSHEVGETQLGTQAQVMSTSLRQLKSVISKANTVFIFINQLREVVDLSWAGQQKAARIGKQYDTPGGKALKFYADMRLEFMQSGVEKKEQEVLMGGDPKSGRGNVVVGQRSKVTAVKNKCGIPWRSLEIYMPHGKGTSDTKPCVDLAVDKFDLIPSKGAYYTLKKPLCEDNLEEQTIHGKDNLYAYFESRDDKLAILFQSVWKNMTGENNA
jgi:recombination protein RecA